MVGLHYFYLKGLVGERWLISGFYGPLFLKIDHTDNNNSGDKGGHSGNATGYCKGTVIDPEMLLAKFAEELKKIKGPISKDDVVQLLKDFYRKMVEVWNLKNTMEAGTSTQGEEQVKVQIMKGEKSSHHSSYIDATYDPREENTLEALVKSCGTLVKTGDRLDQQNVLDPCNFNANPTEQTKKWDCLINNHNINGMGANPSYCARTVPPSTDQVFGPTANVQENLSLDLTATSTGIYHGNSDAGDVTWPFIEIEGILSDWDSYSGWEEWVKEM